MTPDNTLDHKIPGFPDRLDPSRYIVVSHSPGPPPQFTIRHIPDWLDPPGGIPGRLALNQPLSRAMGEIGTLLETLGKELIRNPPDDQIHSADYSDQTGHRHILKIHLRKMTPEEWRRRESGIRIPEPVSTVILIHMEESRSTGGREVTDYRSAVFEGIIGISAPMQALFHRVQLYAPTEAPVVITGETGTGKELVARAIHHLSRRKDRPFVAVNCTALNEELFESELFGHERGAFTGAVRSHRGRFERANGGTLFLDEIGDMPMRSQAKLLRVLEQQSIERVGSEQAIEVDVRILAATNVSLEHTVGGGRFRPDLYHRLAVLRIHVPPLRDRLEDIPLLVQYCLDNLNRRYGKDIVRLSPDAMRLLGDYRWPGNIRELLNVLERVYVETQGNIIGRKAFREWVQERDFLAAGQWDLHYSELQRLARNPIVTPDRHRAHRMPRASDLSPFHSAAFSRKALPSGEPPVKDYLEGDFQVSDNGSGPDQPVTKERLAEAFAAARGNITRAAALLGIHKATFYRQMKRLHLSRKDLEK